MNRSGALLAWRFSTACTAGNSSQIGRSLGGASRLTYPPTSTSLQTSRRTFTKITPCTQPQISSPLAPLRPQSTIRQRLTQLFHERFYASRVPNSPPHRSSTRHAARRWAVHPGIDPTDRSQRGRRPEPEPEPQPEKEGQEEEPRDERTFNEKVKLLLSPTYFTLLVCAGSYWYATTYVPPKNSERMFPELHPADVTVWSIIGLNVAVFLLWRVPIPANWRILNKYFISSSLKPNAFSMLGNTFSHQQVMHIFMNCYVLNSFGGVVCDELGRGTFLGLYISSCVVSSLASLWYTIFFRTAVNVHALGASGAIMAIVGNFIQHHPNAEIHIIFLPFLSTTAENAAILFSLVEVAGLIFRWHYLDHMAHLSGLVYGYLLAKWIDSKRRVKRKVLGMKPV